MPWGLPWVTDLPDCPLSWTGPVQQLMVLCCLKGWVLAGSDQCSSLSWRRILSGRVNVSIRWYCSNIPQWAPLFFSGSVLAVGSHSLPWRPCSAWHGCSFGWLCTTPVMTWTRKMWNPQQHTHIRATHLTMYWVHHWDDCIELRPWMLQSAGAPALL